MKCESFRDLLPELLAGGLTAADADAAEAHARSCAGCGEELAGHRRTWQMLGVLDPAEELAPDRLDRFAEAALARARLPDDGGRPVATVRVLPVSRWRSVATRVAAAVLLVAATAFTTRWWMGRGGELPDFLDEPDFVTHFDLLRDLPALDSDGELLDLEDDLTTLDAMQGA